jgi:hypothetical protein
MNELESKSEILYSSIYSILKNDDTNTGKTVREINFYVADRIVRKYLRHNFGNPKILMEITEQVSNLGLPTAKYLLELTAVVDETENYALTIIDRICSRIEFLFNKKQTSINLVYPSKNLRCRTINKMSAIPSYDGLEKVHKKNIIFDIIVDDENLECN